MLSLRLAAIDAITTFNEVVCSWPILFLKSFEHGTSGKCFIKYESYLAHAVMQAQRTKLKTEYDLLKMFLVGWTGQHRGLVELASRCDFGAQNCKTTPHRTCSATSRCTLCGKCGCTACASPRARCAPRSRSRKPPRYSDCLRDAAGPSLDDTRVPLAKKATLWVNAF